MEAIIDRNVLDIEYAKKLVTKIKDTGFSSLTSVEAQRWEEGLKGMLNYTDLNRIEGNCKILSDVFGIDLVTDSAWEMTRFPTKKDFERIRDNVATIRERGYVNEFTPNTPTMPLNRYDKINDIEKILLDAYEIYRGNEDQQYYLDEIFIDESVGVI